MTAPGLIVVFPSGDDEGVILDWAEEIADRRAWPAPPVADIPTRPRVWVWATERPTLD